MYLDLYTYMYVQVVASSTVYVMACTLGTYEGCFFCFERRRRAVLGGSGVLYPPRECLLLPKVVTVFPVQHLRALSLSVYLVAGAILSVDRTQRVVLLVRPKRAIQRVAVQRRRSSNFRLILSLLAAYWHGNTRRSQLAS